MEISEKHYNDSLSGLPGVFAGVVGMIGASTAILYLRSVSGQSVQQFLIADAIMEKNEIKNHV